MVGLGAVPLQDMDLALRELEYAFRTLGFPGVEVGSNINGKPIGAPEFDPFFEACEQLGAAVFVHAIRPAGMDRLVGPPPLQQVLGYPTDVGLAAASVLTTNLIERRPGLRIAFSHGGGTLGLLLPRLHQRLVRVPGAEGGQSAPRPREQPPSCFYDTWCSTADPVPPGSPVRRNAADRRAPDYFHFHERAPVAAVEAAGFGRATRECCCAASTTSSGSDAMTNRRRVLASLALLGATGKGLRRPLSVAPGQADRRQRAGSSVDTIGRIVGAQLATVLGQPLVVDNKAGAAGASASNPARRRRRTATR
jgi:hypothetical protein